jgi:hypothetical protein
MLTRLAQAQQVYNTAVRQYHGDLGVAMILDLAWAEAYLAFTQVQLTDS